MPKKAHTRAAADNFTIGGKRSYISLFSSAGVGCYGFSNDAFECIATNELLPERLDVQRANKKCRFDCGYICGDIRDDATQKSLFNAIDFWQKNHGLKKVDVVFATPPCQGMSTVNYKKNEREKVRNSLVVEAIKLIKKIQPRIFVIENVRAFLTTVCTDISGLDIPIADSIRRNLGDDYLIYAKVINFKDYGVPSSRPRTLVIGTHRSMRNVAPLNLFPTRQLQRTLRDAIGSMPPLAFGEKDTEDPLHFARPYPDYMVRWIENLKEGESAFGQEESRRPYKIDKEGKRVALKGAYMGNKYRRLFWDRPCACIATRNDQLASQDTIHPRDNRVLSIRELMRLMTIPDSFRWSSDDAGVTPQNSDAYLKKHELNIRRCIGEAVPTSIIAQISRKVCEMLDFEDFVAACRPGDEALQLQSEAARTNFYIRTFLQEQLISDARSSGAFYTPQCVVFDAIKDLHPSATHIRVLEPAVGLGAFLPQLAALLSDAESVEIDAVEISAATLAQLRDALPLAHLGSNVRVNCIHSDFLDFEPDGHYDIVVSNPPYGKLPSAAKTGRSYSSGNLFAIFMERFRTYADDIVCVIPKNFAIAAEYGPLRRLYEDLPVVSICDFGVKFFAKVFVEILSVHFSAGYEGPLAVTNYLSGIRMRHPQGYICHDRLWLLYRNEWFDRYIRTLRLDVFDFFRDRQITNSHLRPAGKIWVVKSKNVLDDGSVVHIPGYDRYVDTPDQFAVGRYLNSGALLMPNFTYNTRAAFLPAGSIPNGSIAVLLPKEDVRVTDTAIYATPEFREYYAIVKSYSKFTLNIDNSSIYYIGIPYDDTIQ